MRDVKPNHRNRLVLVLAAVAALFVAVLASPVGAVEPSTTTIDPSVGAPESSVAVDSSTSTSTTSTTIDDTTEVTAPDGVVETTGGDLVWGVRSSFVNYVRGPIAKGAIAVAGGAVDNTATDGTFTFPAVAGGTFDGATNDTDVSFAGSVRFTGHNEGAGPQLDLLIENLRILRDDTGSWLVGDVLSVPFHGTSGGSGAPDPAETFEDLKLVALATDGVLPVSTPPDGLTWYDLAATLTEDAVPPFGFYAAGEPMDPVTYTLTFDEVPDVPVDPIGPIAPVVTLDQSTVTAGDLLTATGPGFVAGEQVEVWLHSTPTWITTATADATGSVTATFVVPIDTPGGTHQIEMRGISSGDSISSSDFTVIAAATTTAGPGTLPATGADGRIAVAGTLLLSIGVALVVLSRRSRIALGR